MRVLAVLIFTAASVIPAAAQTTPKLRFVPVTPCRVKDTRLPDLIITPLAAIDGGTTRSFQVGGHCGVPSSAAAYSLNVTAIPLQPLSYITVWPGGEPQPFTSLLNSWNGSVVAAATIVKAGANGSVSVFATEPTHLVLDVNGYFIESNSASDLVFYPVTPCRVVDSRLLAAPLSPPPFQGGTARRVTIGGGPCGIPTSASAYSLNFTVVVPQGGALSYLTAYPAGIQRPNVSTLNAYNGGVVANAAIVPAGNGAIDVFVTETTDVIIDINGYFAPSGQPGGLSLTMRNSCRVADTREGQGTTGSLGPPSLGVNETRTLNLPAGRCALPQVSAAGSVAWVLNTTVVPKRPLAFLTLWPTGLAARPVVSTLNSFTGTAVSNMAIVPGGTAGSIDVFVTDPADLVLDVSGYFSP